MRLSNLDIVTKATSAFSTWTITPKDFGVPSRKVNYWKTKGLLPYVEDEKHLKMNIYQGLWFHIIHQLTNLLTSKYHIVQHQLIGDTYIIGNPLPSRVFK